MGHRLYYIPPAHGEADAPTRNAVRLREGEKLDDGQLERTGLGAQERWGLFVVINIGVGGVICQDEPVLLREA